MEEGVKKMVKELWNMENGMVFIEEMDVLVEKGEGNRGGGNVLKWEVWEGEVRVMGGRRIEE